MSPKLNTPSGGGAGRGLITALLILIVAVVMLLIVRARPSVERYDPRSGDDGGTRGLVLLLERIGADVEISRSVPQMGTDARLLIIDDRLTGTQRSDVLQFAEQGVVVVADPDSTLHGGPGEEGGSEVVGDGFVVGGSRSSAEDEANVPLGACDIPALQHLRGAFVDEGLLYPVAPGTRSCFGDGNNALVFEQLVGDGRIVAIGDNDMFTNSLLRFADNGGLAAALLAPQPGDDVVIVIGGEAPKTADDIGSGDKTLADLVRPGVWMALVQLGLAFLIFAVAAGVRGGRPVKEGRPVPLEGSEFVVANGNLMQRAGHDERAAYLLRADLHRWLCTRYSLPPATTIEAIDHHVATRERVPVGTVSALLQANAAGGAELMNLSRRVASFRTAIEHGDPAFAHASTVGHTNVPSPSTSSTQ